MKSPLFIALLLSCAVTMKTYAENSFNIDDTVIKYSVSGYEIQMEFLPENKLRWTYLNAPNKNEIGKTALETTDRTDLRTGLILFAWTETKGTHVIDIFDFNDNKVYANFILPNGERYQSQSNFSK
ncbi:MoaF-related domain-containing protein [Litoribacillus peritrichatus]|uniref:MoaF-like domain-containing protein n=1 Tax=Litoribacillus peritrichatus TaxID=718191 RepID=A0ABP7N3Y9_9GAMM